MAFEQITALEAAVSPTSWPQRNWGVVEVVVPADLVARNVPRFQAMVERLTIVTRDEAIRRYPVPVIAA